MRETESEENNQMRRLTDQQTLESWKAIANYLNRSVRTVRRWETYEGLPVHRQKHTRGSSVYAYSAELDEWRGRHRNIQQPDGVATRRSAGAARFAAGMLAVVALAAASWIFVLNPDPAEPPAGDAWVLIASATGDDDIVSVGDNLDAALRREISRLRHRHTVPQQRVQNALALMRLQPDVTLDTTTARNVALRDGRVSAVLIPHLERLGDVIVLSVEILDPHSGAIVAYPSENAGNMQAAVPAVRNLAKNVGRDLLRLPAATESSPLVQVTTSSMNALHLYMQAETMLLEDLPAAGRELLRLAVVDDPEFGSALALQAWASRRAGDSPEVYRPIAESAAKVTDRVSLSERYFINGTRHFFTGDVSLAATDFQALFEIEPDHLLGVQAMLDLCLDSQPATNCASAWIQLAELRPDHFESNLEAAWALAADGADKSLAAEFADRSRQLLQQSHVAVAPASAARALMFPVISAWTEGNLQEAIQQSKILQESLTALRPATKNAVVRNLIAMSLSLGKLEEARGLIEQIDDAAERHELRAVVMFASGEKKGLKGHLASGKNYEEQFTALLLSMAGFPEQALALHDQLLASGMNTAQGAVVRAIIALGDGRPEFAKTELQSVVDKLAAEDQAYYFVGPDMLAKILETEGDLVGALSMLETTSSRRVEAAYNNSALFWMMCQRQLAKLYREAGRELEAIRIENNLRELLILADDDFPLAQSLKEA
jgi:hypothetical protein